MEIIVIKKSLTGKTYKSNIVPRIKNKLLGFNIRLARYELVEDYEECYKILQMKKDYMNSEELSIKKYVPNPKEVLEEIDILTIKTLGS